MVSRRPVYDDRNAATLNPTRTGDGKSKEITSGDSPGGGPPIMYEQHSYYQAGDDILDSMELVHSFNTHVTARTTDPRNGASTIYTPRAKGSWTFDATGDIDPTDLYFYAWTQTGAGLTVPAGWTDVADGLQVHTTPPLDSDELFEDAANNATWSDPGP